jgi:hypothetical protein
VTVKLLPSFVRLEVVSFRFPEEVTMLIGVLEEKEPISPVDPPIVAVQVDATPVYCEPKPTVPKSAKGSTPPE